MGSLEVSLDELRRALRSLVLTCLVGEYYKVEALKLYVVDNLSPSTIADIFRVSKFSIRGYCQRVMNTCRASLLASFLEKCYRDLLKVDSIVVKSPAGWVCLVCKSVVAGTRPDHHVRAKHQNVVDEHVEKLLKLFLERTGRRSENKKAF
jgi:hypothetical protein